MDIQIKKKRNVKVELIRIIGCFAVIWYHIRQLPFKDNGDLSETNVFFECICTICVMTFFLMSGFFIYNKKGNIWIDWKNQLINFFKKVFIPFILVVIFCTIFHDFLISTDTFIGCLQKIDIAKSFSMIFDSFVHFTSDYLPGTCAHLWYVYSYFLILLVYPITRTLIQKLPRIVIYVILGVFAVCMIINDYHLFFANPTYNIIFQIIPKPIFYSVCGCVLYNDILKKFVDEHKENLIANAKKVPFIINKILFVVSLLIYSITFWWLWKVQCAYDILVNGPYVYTSWLSLFSLILTSAFVCIVYTLDLDRFINERVEKVVYYIANKTLLIYIVHYLFITKFLSIGLQNYFQTGFSHIIQYFIYFIFYGLFIFVVSFAFIWIMETLMNLILRMFKRK